MLIINSYVYSFTMLIHPEKFIFFLVFPLLAACVSIDSRMQLVSEATGARSERQSCDMKPVLKSPAVNSEGLNPENIAFLNWNIYKGNGESWESDLSSYARNHDLMTIQEAVLDDELTGLLNTLELNWIMNTAFHLNGSAAGVMTIANLEAIHSCGFKVVEPIIRVPKSTLVSYYVIDGFEEKLLVANIHGINFTFGLSVYRQQLDQLYDAIKHHNGPMIVAGDFNSWSTDRMAEVSQLIDKLSLSEIEYPVNNKTHFFGNAIDHVFYRQLELVDNKVWQVSSSDHNPISVNFRLQSTI